MKRIFKKIMYRSPELTVSLGCMAIYLAASSSDYGMMHGSGSPEWTGWAVLGGFLFVGFGVFLGRVRGEVNRAKKTDKR